LDRIRMNLLELIKDVAKDTIIETQKYIGDCIEGLESRAKKYLKNYSAVYQNAINIYNDRKVELNRQISKNELYIVQIGTHIKEMNSLIKIGSDSYVKTR